MTLKKQTTILWLLLIFILQGCGKGTVSYFEEVIGTDFPSGTKIQDTHDNGEFFCELRGTMDKTDAVEYRREIGGSLSLPQGAKLDKPMSVSSPQLSAASTWVLDSCTGLHKIHLEMDEATGEFWGRVFYPDPGGDPPCK